MYQHRFPTILALTLAILLIATSRLAALSWENLRLTGYVETDNRFTTQEKARYTFNEDTLKTQLQAFPAENVELLASVRFKAIGFDERTDNKNLISIYEQQQYSEVDPLAVILDEAYLSVHGLISEKLDIKLGKQLIMWGTGDQFNPTNNINPYDIHDPLLFGKKLPTPAIKATYYLGSFTLTGAILPLFYPALLPLTDVRPIFEAQFRTMTSQFKIQTGNDNLDEFLKSAMARVFPNVHLGTIDINSAEPDKAVRNTSGGFRIANKIGPVDVSASYAYVWNDFGVPRRVTISVDPLAAIAAKGVNSVDVHVLQQFPREQVIGADFATNIPKLDVGAWGEVAVFFPNTINTDYFLDAGQVVNSLLKLPDGLKISQTVATKNPYVKAVLGADYTFPGALYCNIQYVRGLPNDNTADTMADYVFGGFDKPYFHDKLKPRIFAGYCFSDSSSILYPQIFYYPIDSLEFHVGELFVFGKPDTKFGAFGDDIFFIQARLSF